MSEIADLKQELNIHVVSGFLTAPGLFFWQLILISNKSWIINMAPANGWVTNNRKYPYSN